MEKVKLKDICSMQSGGTPSRSKSEFYTGNIPWAKISDLEKSNDGYIYETEEHITEEALKSINNRFFKVGTLLLAMYGSVGKTAIAKIDLSTNQAILGINIIDKNNVDIKYLRYWFTTIKEQLLNRAVGAALANISLGIVKELEIPLPNLATQQRIAAILDQADAIIQNNRAIVQKYDALTQSLFLDMFGDPVKNEKGWEVKSLNDLCNKITDGTHDTPKRLTEGIKFITGKHIRPFEIDYDNSDYVTEEIHKEIFKRCNPEYGDVLYTNIGVNFATAAMNTVEYEFSMKNVALLKYNRELLNGRYLVHILNNEFFKDKLKKTFGVGGAQQFLSLSNIKSILVLVPPITLQNQFAERVAMIEAQKQQAQLELAKSEELFQSLLQRAFKGELS
jgi:type I restriction enzyme S subunit